MFRLSGLSAGASATDPDNEWLGATYTPGQVRDFLNVQGFIEYVSGLGLMILHIYGQSGVAKNRGRKPAPVRHDSLLWLEQPDYAIDGRARNLATRH